MNEFKIDEMLEARLLNIFKDEKYYNNKELINYLSQSFSQKKLPRSIPNKLFMELMTVDELEFVEFAYLLQKLYDFGWDFNIKEFLQLKPSDYYSDLMLKEMKEFAPKNEELTQIVFHNVDRVNDFQWICSFSPVTDLVPYKKNELFSYDFSTQRDAKIRIVGTEGAVAKEVNINPNSVSDISDLIYHNKFTANMITLNVPLLGENNDERIAYDPITRTLVITPDFNIDGGQITYCNVIDGYHRLTAAEDAYNRKIEAGENPEELENGFVISINNMTPDEARIHFKRENTYNPVAKSYLETFNTSNEGKFVRAMIETGNEFNNIFKNKVMTTFEECKAGKQLTYCKVLEDGLKCTDINVKNAKSLKFVKPRVIKFVNDLVVKLIKEFGVRNYIELRNKTPLLDTNIFIGYIKVASIIPTDDDIEDYVDLLCEQLKEDSILLELRDMKLNNKNYSAEKIANYFKKMVA